MKRKVTRSLIGAVLNAAAWNLVLFLLLSIASSDHSPAENYGIIAGWGLALYAAGLYRPPLGAMPLCLLMYAVWASIRAIWFGQAAAADLPPAVYALVGVARALVFASPVGVNWIVQLTIARAARMRWFSQAPLGTPEPEAKRQTS